jgi:hemolysin-activating ACP:hemolysin acyltransferase
MNNTQIISTNKRLDLLTEIEQTPDEYISDLLQIVRLFRQSVTMKQTSVNAWSDAINQLNNGQYNQEKQEKIKKLFQSWSELDDENEQKETLKIIESLEGVSI